MHTIFLIVGLLERIGGAIFIGMGFGQVIFHYFQCRKMNKTAVQKFHVNQQVWVEACLLLLIGLTLRSIALI